jgi:hypothetical protein
MKKTTKILLLAVLLTTFTLQSCAVFKKKCDCPRFGNNSKAILTKAHA